MSPRMKGRVYRAVRDWIRAIALDLTIHKSSRLAREAIRQGFVLSDRDGRRIEFLQQTNDQDRT